MDMSNVRVTHAGVMQHNSDGTKELQKLTQAGLVARSPEGTAAKGMNIRGNEDLWVEIQANTFRNWVNEHLKETGRRVNDLSTDFSDGTHLCALVEALQKKKLKPQWNARPTNHHQFLENASTALNAIEADGVKLVNIGNVDIVNGNLKLILGLIWSLIFRYQIGRSKFPPRKLMLAWLQAALPQCKVGNLTTDWNSGVFLSALLDYCEPGLFPHWRSLDPHQSVRNCTNAMNIASREFGIPQVLEPEYLASPWLDELSGMTYLSYFMKPGGPGYNASMRWVNTQVEKSVTNFTVRPVSVHLLPCVFNIPYVCRRIGTMVRSFARSSTSWAVTHRSQRDSAMIPIPTRRTSRRPWMREKNWECALYSPPRTWLTPRWNIWVL